MFSACNTNPEDIPSPTSTKEISTSGINDSAELRKKLIKGKVIDLDTMPAPKVVPAGNPRVVPFKNNIYEAGTPKVVNIPKNLTVIIPGKDSVPLPETLRVITREFALDYTEPIKTLPPRFMDESNCNVTSYSKDQGFNGDVIWKIIQDKNQNIWMVGGGLIKFDGTFFTQFDNFVSTGGRYHLCPRSILEDTKGNIWFVRGGYDTCLRIYKYNGRDVTEFMVYNNNDRIKINNPNSILEDKNGNLWIGTDASGVCKYEPESQKYPKGRFIHYTQKEGLIGNKIKCIAEDNNGNIWLGTTDSGLCKYESNSNDFPAGRFKHYTVENGLSNNYISSLLFDSKGRLWIGTFGSGLDIYDGKSFIHFSENEGLSSNFINDIIEDRKRNIWIATHGGGVCKFELESTEEIKGRFQYFTVNDNLSSNHIQSIMEDNNGCLWFGTHEEGVMVYDPNSFKHITPKMGMEFDFLRSPIEDEDENLWFGEERGGGLCKFDGKSFSYFTRKEGLCGDSVTSVIPDKTGNIWIGTSGGGLCKYDGKYFTHYTKENGLSDNFIKYLLEDKTGNIWIGTEYGGVCRFNGKSFIHFTKNEGLCDNKVQYILEDSKGNLWFATYSGGVDKYDGKYFTNYNDENGLNGNKIASLLEDKRGNIWIGTEGITRFDPDTTDISSRFIQFLKKGRRPKLENLKYFDILSNDGLKFLVEDKTGNLWAGTGGGINLLVMPENGTLDNIQVEIFNKQDGLKGDNPVINSAFIDSKNRLFYGYNRAITMLDLNTFEPATQAPAIQLNNIELEQTFIDFRKLSKTIKAGKQFLIGANKDISLNKVKFTEVAPFYNYPVNLELPYRINHLTFKFSAIDWQAPHKIRYQYKLEGSDRDWRNITKETKAIYTNLTHGHYEFKVKAIGAANKWSDTFEYDFLIRPPWWYSWWAYVIYSIILLALIFAWRSYDLKRHRLKQELEIEHVQTEKLEELDKMKSRFFANISHEFRTPLTLILGPLQNLLSKASDKESEQELDMMQRNARRLQKLINQLLNLSKLEAGKMKLQAREENIVSLARLFVQSYESYATQRNISLLFTSEADEILVYVDREKIEKILNNLLSNAFKFTPDGGSIEVTVGSGKSEDRSREPEVGSPKFAVGSQCVEIKVSDTGAGISSDRLEHIFDRFYQADDSYTKDQEGSGIGLALTKELVDLHNGEIIVESDPGRETTFSVYLPMGKSHLKVEEILKKKEPVYEQFVPNIPDSISLTDEQKPLTEDQPADTLDTTTPIVLIVEDNADLRLYIRGFLDQNYHVIEAIDGKDGLNKAIKIIPDLIISDVMMPNMDGYQLCNKLKTDEKTSHIPIILLTARASMESKIEGLETGADDFITKPFEPQELQVRVKNLIEQRNKLKEWYKKEMSVEEHKPIPVLPTIDQQFLEKAKNVVHQNMAEPDFSVEDFVKETAMSRTQLHRKLRALVDQSASEFIRTLRLNRAAELLLQNIGNISEISYDVGFNNPPYFSDCFNKQFGMSPSEYITKNFKSSNDQG